MTLIENRRHADLSGDYKKGSAQTLSASSNVFWAVPPLTEGAEVPNLIAYRINQDEIVRNQREFISRSMTAGMKRGMKGRGIGRLKQRTLALIPRLNLMSGLKNRKTQQGLRIRLVQSLKRVSA